MEVEMDGERIRGERAVVGIEMPPERSHCDTQVTASLKMYYPRTKAELYLLGNFSLDLWGL